MKALEYESVNQADREDVVGQSIKKSYRKVWTFGPAIHVQRQTQYGAMLLIFTLAVAAISLHIHRNGKDGMYHQLNEQGMLYVTPELIKSEHGTISSTFFAPSSPEDTTCADKLSLEKKKKKQNAYGCISDRLQNNELMERGTMLCSEGGRYSFGFSKNSNGLVWRDCRDGSERVYYRCPSPKDCAFVLSKNGTFTITEGVASQNIKVVHQKPSKVYIDAGESSSECLAEPRYDCPYIHLHSSGKLVLHYIDENGSFKQKGTDKVYSFDYYYCSHPRL